ncbi:MAG: acyltransferase family protein [Muribaculaceae bacterium]
MSTHLTDSSAAASPTSRIPVLDLIKTVAMLGVIGLHSFNGPAYYCMAFAMPVFFMMTGYLQITRPRTVSYCAIKIYKIARYLLLLGICYTIAGYIIRGEVVPIDIVKNIYRGVVQHNNLGLVWFLAALALVYVAMPLLSYLYGRHRRLFIALTIGLMVWQGLSFARELVAGVPLESHTPQFLRLWHWFGYACLGALLRETRLQQLLRHLWLLLIPAIVATAMLGVRYSWLAECFYGSLPVVIYSTAIFVLLLRVPIKPSRLIAAIPPLFVPVYTIHWYVVDVLRPFFSGLPLFIATTIVSVGLAWVVTRPPLLRRLLTV